MPHELIAGLEAGAVVLLVLLLVPKRGLDHLRARFSDLHAGRRRWLFEPPPRRDRTRPEGNRQAAAEAVEVLELGVPLYVAGLLAEQRSAQLHLERQSRWADSPKALLAAHLKGAMSEVELHGQLKSRGLPLPAAKTVAAKVEARPLISIKWWLERQAMAHATANPNGDSQGRRAGVGPLIEEAADETTAEDTEEAEPSPVAPADPSHLTIRTFGRIELLQAGEDYAPILMRKRVLAFVWLYLFVRGLLEPEGRVDRGAFADEFSPGLSPEKQRKRLRDRLDDMFNRDLPEALSSRVVADRQELRLDLSKCSIDIVRLQELAKQCAAKYGMLTGDLAAEASRILEETQGEFLPGWEQIESDTNGGRGAAAEYVRVLRQAAETARVDLMGALAADHLARQEPRKAIPLLEQALERQSDREDLARKLRAAYLETGQMARAAELQRDHALDT
jgi:DNA-binding SARP family transcriptional activator